MPRMVADFALHSPRENLVGFAGYTPTKAKSNGVYENKLTGDKSDRIRIVTIRDLVENKKRLELPQSMEALKLALRALESKQMSLDLKPPVAVVEPEARKGVGRALDVLASKSRASK